MADRPPLPPPSVPEKGPIEPTKGFEAEKQIKPPDQQAFERAMTEAPTPAGKKVAEAPGGVTPMELATPKMAAAGPSFDSLLSQIDTTQHNYDQIQNNLKTPNLSLKYSYQKLLDNKLNDAQDQLNSASEKLGLPPQGKTQVSADAGPIASFIGKITDGQNQLQSIKDKLIAMKQSGDEMKPGEMLLIQIKLAQAQQEIEYSSVLLSKVVDIIKQLMNIQI